MTPVPSFTGAVGLHAAAAAQAVDLPCMPVVQPPPPHEAPEGLGEEEAAEEAAAAPRAASSASFSSAPGLEGCPETGEAVQARLGAQLGSEEERRKGNDFYRKHQYELVSLQGAVGRCWLPPLWALLSGCHCSPCLPLPLAVRPNPRCRRCATISAPRSWTRAASSL